MEKSKKAGKSAPNTIVLILVLLLALTVFLGYKQSARVNSIRESHTARISRMKESYKEKLEWNKVLEKVTASETAIDIKLATSRKLREELARVIMDFQPKLDRQVAEKIVHYIFEEAPRNGIDPILIAALMWVESRFDPFAKSNKGAIGLMQIRYKIWKKEPALLENGARKEGSLYWIDINIKSGIAIFFEYYEHAKLDVIKTLYRYNTGSTKLPKGKRYYEIPYVNKVLISAYKIRSALARH